jgi:hypothetical protein
MTAIISEALYNWCIEIDEKSSGLTNDVAVPNKVMDNALAQCDL